ncbi:MAG: GGDEF domain-containing protein [Candidatus Competibacteraceae bacterium]
MAKINLLLKKKTYTDQLYDNYQAAINSAIKDGLTNLFKRSYFIRCLDHEIKRTLRTMGCLSLMIIDIDNFKAINDHLGHLAGDAILYEFGKIILNNIRDIDQAARYGGEEFIILLPNTKKEKALLIAQRIQSALLEIPLPSNLPSILNKLTVSIGIAEFPCCATSSSELLNKADLMLYQAKKTGKNKVCL